MQTELFVIYWLNIFSFFAYGTSCLFSSRMKREFKRYKLPQLRKITGALQILSSLGLAFGIYAPAMGITSAFSLAFMMVVAIIIRFQIKDSILSMIPALIYFAINLLIMNYFSKLL